MTSVLNVDTIAAKDGTSPVGLTKQYTSKQWANVDHNTDNAIDNSVNTSSLTDNGTGLSTLAFTNSFANTLQVPSLESFRSSYPVTSTNVGVALPTTGTIYIVTMDYGGTLADCEYGCSVTGDLA